MTAVERVAEVLAEHALRPTDPACTCGWDWDCLQVILPSAVDFDSSRYRLADVVRPEQHRAHVAAALSAAGCLRDDREGADLAPTASHPCCRHCVTEPGEDHVTPHDGPCDVCGSAATDLPDDREGETVTEWAVDFSLPQGRGWVNGWSKAYASREEAAAAASRQVDGKAMSRTVTPWSLVAADGGA